MINFVLKELPDWKEDRYKNKLPLGNMGVIWFKKKMLMIRDRKRGPWYNFEGQDSFLKQMFLNVVLEDE